MMKRTFAIMMAILLLMGALALSVSANSAQTQWRGVDSTGAVVVSGNCPIRVTKEVLTFDIAEFPAQYYRDQEQLLAYSGKVTAEYTFYNPTDMTVTATLAFPFGTQPDYASTIYDEETQSYLTYADTEKYDITVNGQAIEKKIRYTLQWDRQFDLSRDLPKLHDTYVNDAFYKPDMTVTKYTYIVGGVNKDGLIDEEKYPAAMAAFDWNGGNGNTKLYFPEMNGFHTQKDGDGRFGRSSDNGDVFDVYAIGQPFSEPLAWKCYKDGGVEDREVIDGTVELIGTETMTLEEFALEKWSEDTGVSKVDWYNAVIDAFDENIGGNAVYNYIDASFQYGFERNLMRWYQYEITVEPGQSIVNTVTAPIYPAINLRYEPDIYSYTYLLSPASTWAAFGELEIIVNTPFFITENSLDGFEKTDTGYRMTRNGLPGGELEFTLCTEENPIKPVSNITNYIPIEIVISFSVIGGMLLLCGGGVALAVILIIKKKKSKNT